jgi:DNA-binding GntR family transcriptional regulator
MLNDKKSSPWICRTATEDIMKETTKITQSGETVRPIESADDIARIRRSLVNKPRDLFLFDMATQTGVAAEKWLQLKVGQLSILNPGDELPLTSKGKNSKSTRVMNEVLHRSFRKYLTEIQPLETDFIFKSRKGSRPLTLSSVSRIVKGWLKGNKIEGHGGLLALRKTWAFHAAENFGSSVGNENAPKRSEYLRPIRVPTRQEVVYKELEAAILSGHIRPGERIITEEIAQRLAVSKIPVREALRRLEAGGLISTRPNCGSTVTELSKENLKEILQIRINLECMAAQKAASSENADLLDRLNTHHRQYSTARASNIADRLLQSNKEFHHTLYRAANMPILLNMIEQLWDKVSPYYYILFRQSAKPNPVIGIRYHQEIINAVKRKDPDEVSKWIEADLTDSTQFVLSIFDEKNLDTVNID